MQSDTLIEQFTRHCGEDKFRRFMAALSRESRDTYRLRHWQQALVNAFISSPGQNLTSLQLLHALSDGKEYVYSCPTRGCSYIVICTNHDADEWSCPECGTTWKGIHALFNAIHETVVLHPYRRNCYIFVADSIEPAPREIYSPNYPTLVRAEWALNPSHPSESQE